MHSDKGAVICINASNQSTRRASIRSSKHHCSGAPLIDWSADTADGDVPGPAWGTHSQQVGLARVKESAQQQLAILGSKRGGLV